MHRQAREGGTATGSGERGINNSEISQETEAQSSGTVRTPRSGEISPNKQGQEPLIDITPKSGEISPGQREERGPHGATESRQDLTKGTK